MKESVYCSVATHEQLNTLLEAIKADGIAPDDVSVILADKPGVWDSGIGRAPEGSVIGIGAGSALGGAFGWLASIGAVMTPVAGPFLALGPILACLGGAVLGSALGCLTGGFIGLGIPEAQAEILEGRIREGRAVVSVHTSTLSSMSHIVGFCESVGAEDITCVRDPASQLRQSRS